jgi:hypothetical protein
MNRFAIPAIWCLAAGISTPLVAQSLPEQSSLERQQSLVRILQNTEKCETLSGSRYCTISFRGLTVEFAGIGSKDGSAIYVNSMGKGQRVSARFGGRCITVAFKDEDLRGRFPEIEIIFREDGTLTHVTNNITAWQACRD